MVRLPLGGAAWTPHPVPGGPAGQCLAGYTQPFDVELTNLSLHLRIRRPCYRQLAGVWRDRQFRVGRGDRTGPTV